MIRHIVMWKLKEYAEGADRLSNAQKMKTLLQACAAIVPGILRFDVALAQDGLESTSDVVFYAEFVDKNTLDAYQAHPQHQALKPFFAAVREGRQCMDTFFE
ncbi:MAG: Dabb family protein [Pseudomonadota bacterium]